MKTFLLTFFLILAVLVSFHCSIIAQSNPNLIPNGGFEQSSGSPSGATDDFSSAITWWDVAQYDGDNCQNAYHGTAVHPCGGSDYVSISLDNGYTSANSCSSPSYPSNLFVSMASGSVEYPTGYCHHSSGIRVQLIKDGQPYSLVQGHTYLLKLKLRLGSMTSSSLMDNLMIHFAKFSTNWNANPNTSTNRKLSNATSFQLAPSAYDPCIWYPFERTFVVPEVCDGNENCDYLQNMILYLDDNNSEEISASLSIDDVELYDEGCCIQYKQYENTSDLTDLTHTSDYIRAGFDAGISGTSGNVTVLSGQNISFKAGNQIILEPGFSVQSGASFIASIEDCNSSAATGSINVPFLPNVFTPNGDGVNDNYCINVTGANQYHIQVFDSWGVLRFDYLDFIYSSWACLWDGRCNQGYPNCSSPTVPDGTYSYIITLFNCSGSVEYVGFVSIYGTRNIEADSTANTIPNNSSIFQNNSSDIVIFPNPNSGKFQLHLTANNFPRTIHKITILDIRGNRVWETLNTSNQLFEVDISSQSKGVYFIKIENEQGIKVEKIVYQ